MPIISGKFELYESDDQVNKLYPQTEWASAPRAKHYNKEIKHEGRTYLYRAKMEREAPRMEKIIKYTLGCLLTGAAFILPLTSKKYAAILLLLPFASEKCRNFFFPSKEVHKCAIDKNHLDKLRFIGLVENLDITYIQIRKDYSFKFIENILAQCSENEKKLITPLLREKFAAMKYFDMEYEDVTVDLRILGINKGDIVNFVKLDAKRIDWKTFKFKHGDALKHFSSDERKEIWHPELTALIKTKPFKLSSEIIYDCVYHLGLRDVLKKEMLIELEKMEDLNSLRKTFPKICFTQNLLERNDPKISNLVNEFLNKLDTDTTLNIEECLDYLYENNLIPEKIMKPINKWKNDLMTARSEDNLSKETPEIMIQKALDEEKVALDQLEKQYPGVEAKLVEWDQASDILLHFEKRKENMSDVRDSERCSLGWVISLINSDLIEPMDEIGKLCTQQIKNIKHNKYTNDLGPRIAHYNETQKKKLQHIRDMLDKINLDNDVNIVNDYRQAMTSRIKLAGDEEILKEYFAKKSEITDRRLRKVAAANEKPKTEKEIFDTLLKELQN